MLSLGWAAEFAADPIFVNTLWPQTAIATAAINHLGGEEMMNSSRSPAIMAEAAYAILTSTITGKHCIDETVLAEMKQVSDFRPYQWDSSKDPSEMQSH